jgi:hypothetical protein
MPVTTMRISGIVNELLTIRHRFGDLEVRAGGATITTVAVLPYAAIERADNSQQPNMKLFAALLSRHEDHDAFRMLSDRDLDPPKDPT